MDFKEFCGFKCFVVNFVEGWNAIIPFQQRSGVAAEFDGMGVHFPYRIEHRVVMSIEYGSIMFAGGRDTVINSISGVIGHLSANLADLEYLREDMKRIVNASEEFFRAISPVTHIGRVYPAKTDIHGVSVEPGSLVSLCFASANYDEKVFSAPEEVRLDRKPNPHVAFGFGPHLCLGAAHARLVVRSLLKCLCEQVSGIVTIAAQEKIEREERYNRSLAYDSLSVRFTPRR